MAPSLPFPQISDLMKSPPFDLAHIRPKKFTVNHAALSRLLQRRSRFPVSTVVFAIASLYTNRLIIDILGRRDFKQPEFRRRKSNSS
jgi:hypothetical protein